MTMTGSSGSSSLAARMTPKPSPRGSLRSESTTAGALARNCSMASGSSRASTTRCPFDSSARRNIMRSESLSSTIRMGDRATAAAAVREAKWSCRSSADPAGRDVGATGVRLDLRDGLLLFGHVLLEALHVVQHLGALAPDGAALRRILARVEVARQRGHTALERLEIGGTPGEG